MHNDVLLHFSLKSSLPLIQQINSVYLSLTPAPNAMSRPLCFRGMLRKEFKELRHFFYIPIAGNWKQTVKAFQYEGLNVPEFGSRGVLLTS